jgi:septal ring factor EnvC (AmiA/AmiB activator)
VIDTPEALPSAPAWRRLACRAALLALLPALALAAADPAATESQLKRVQARIHEVTSAVQQDVARRDALAGQLHSADEALAAARQRAAAAHEKRAACEARRAELHAAQESAGAALAVERNALAGQLRAAYMGGREEQLKVLLNAQDPATLGRMLVYYAYLTHARTDRIEAIRADAQRLEAIDGALAAENVKLAAVEEELKREAAAVDAARGERQRALGELQARIQKGSSELEELKANAAALDDLLSRLRAALEGFDEDDTLGKGPRQGFRHVAGRLPWPAHGKLLAGFGEARAGGLRWNGVLLGTRPGGEVRAPYFGRVVYADWLPGLGLLLILDHGDGYLSLYGYNDRLYRAVGDTVRPGEIIAASAGEGPIHPELYFEIREGAHPLDPRGWLKGAPRP